MTDKRHRNRGSAATFAAAGVVALSLFVAYGHAAAIGGGGDLSKSTSEEHAVFVALAAGTYRASLAEPAASVRLGAPGWLGTQWASHEHGKVRYATAAFLWRDFSGREVDIVSGPAMSLSPAETLANPRSRIPNWSFAPYSDPTPVRTTKIAGRRALYFDATAPPPGVWTLVGSNPPEVLIEHDYAFRMAAVSVRGKTVVVIIRAPAPAFTSFVPIAARLIGGLSFPSSLRSR